MFHLNKNESEMLNRYGNNLLLIQFILSLAIFLGSLLYFIYIYYKKDEVRLQEDKPKVEEDETTSCNQENQEMSSKKLMDVIDNIMENIMENDMKDIQDMQLDIKNNSVKKPTYNNTITINESEKTVQNMESILNALLDQGESQFNPLIVKSNEVNDLYVESNGIYDDCVGNSEVNQQCINGVEFDCHHERSMTTNSLTKADLNATDVVNSCSINTSSYSESTIDRSNHLPTNNKVSETSIALSKNASSNVSGVVNSSKKSIRRSANTSTTTVNKKPFVTYCSPSSTFPPLEPINKFNHSTSINKFVSKNSTLKRTSGNAQKSINGELDRKKPLVPKWN